MGYDGLAWILAWRDLPSILFRVSNVKYVI